MLDDVGHFPLPRRALGLKGCRMLVEKANAAGGHASVIVLPGQGLNGNSHMLMQARDNLQVPNIVLEQASSCRCGTKARVRSAKR